MAFATLPSRTLIRLVAVFALALAFALPAFESHACEIPADPASLSMTADTTTDDPCLDCGPTCANGCCHAPHPATPPLATIVLHGAAYAHAVWPEPVAGPDLRPEGPERPPRA